MSFRHYLFTVVFSKEAKIIIQNDYEERGWSAYKIWKNHSAKKRTYTSVKRLLKHCKDNGTMNRKEGYDQPRSVTTENTDLIEELICSQEALHTHLAPWIIAKQTGISRLSNGRMIKKKLLSIHKGKNSRNEWWVSHHSINWKDWMQYPYDWKNNMARWQRFYPWRSC